MISPRFEQYCTDFRINRNSHIKGKSHPVGLFQSVQSYSKSSSPKTIAASNSLAWANLALASEALFKSLMSGQCHIVPLLGEGNHKGLPLHDITVCRGNPTCKALNLMAL